MVDYKDRLEKWQREAKEKLEEGVKVAKGNCQKRSRNGKSRC